MTINTSACSACQNNIQIYFCFYGNHVCTLCLLWKLEIIKWQFLLLRQDLYQPDFLRQDLPIPHLP